MKTGIITADVIRSTKLTVKEKDALYQEIDSFIGVIGQQYPLISEWYRGDSFQIKLKNLSDVCRVAFLLKAKIKGIKKNAKRKSFDIKLAIGIGEVDYNKKTLAKSDGEAFHLSGRGIDHLKDSKHNFIIDSNDEHKLSLNMESQFLELIFDKHTNAQNNVIFHCLNFLKQKEIAEEMKVTQSTVNQHVIAANWSLISNFLTYFEKLYPKNLD